MARELMSTAKSKGVLLVAILFLGFSGVISPPAAADISTCPALKPPRAESQAVERALFAFDGVVTSGREVQDPTRGRVLVSPFVFRVLRWVKGGSLYGYALPSGEVLVPRVWDARYARLPDRILENHAPKLRKRVSGEIVATRGEAMAHLCDKRERHKFHVH